MKRTFVLFFIVISAITVSAQRHEIFVGYGLDMVNVPEYKQRPDISQYIPKYKTTYTSATKSNKSISIGYNFRITKKWWIGASWSYLFYKNADTYAVKENGDMAHYGFQKISYHLFLANVKYEWFRYKFLRIYSRIGIGVGFYKNDVDFDHFFEALSSASYPSFFNKEKDEAKFAWQASIAGAELRILRNFGFFIEGGVGQQGVFIAGAKAFF